MKYTDEQAAAIRHGTGPALVLAGPGSGKTCVIIGRVTELISKRGVSPSHILVLTFTKAAAAEMQKRFRFLRIPEKSVTQPVRFGTFHSVFFSILREVCHLTPDAVISEKEEMLFLREILREEKDPNADDYEYRRGILALIAKYKADPAGHYTMASEEDAFTKIRKKYETLCRARKKLDFDDILIESLTLLKKRPELVKLLQKKYEQILVDEAQDINAVQYDLLGILGGKKQELFLVGDDDQAIYGFRGSRPDLLMQFTKDYPETIVYPLSVNFRCGIQISKASGRLIAENRNRFKKQIRSGVSFFGQICYERYATASKEALAICDAIRQEIKQGVPPEEIAVLTRSSRELYMIRAVTEKEGFLCAGASEKKNRPFCIEDMLAYLRIAVGMPQEEDPYRIANRPFRGISHAEVGNSRAWEMVQEDVQFLKKFTAEAAIRYIRNIVGYDRFLREYANERGTDPDSWLILLNGFEKKAGGYRLICDFLRAYDKEEGKENCKGVSFLTYHGAKGLEFTTVFLPALNEGTVPCGSEIDERKMEEERRVFYVALTRAKKRLYLSRPLLHTGRTMQASRFLSELSPSSKNA